jgi:hypothetical protein
VTPPAWEYNVYSTSTVYPSMIVHMELTDKCSSVPTVGQSHCFGCRPPVSPNPPGQIVWENSINQRFADRGYLGTYYIYFFLTLRILGVKIVLVWDLAVPNSEYTKQWNTSFC